MADIYIIISVFLLVVVLIVIFDLHFTGIFSLSNAELRITYGGAINAKQRKDRGYRLITHSQVLPLRGGHKFELVIKFIEPAKIHISTKRRLVVLDSSSPQRTLQHSSKLKGKQYLLLNSSDLPEKIIIREAK